MRLVANLKDLSPVFLIYSLIQVLPTDEDVSTLSDGHVAPGGINIFGIIDGNDHTDGSR
jgi:hypothetical protein